MKQRNRKDGLVNLNDKRNTKDKNTSKQQTFSESMILIGKDNELQIFKSIISYFDVRTQPFSSGTPIGLQKHMCINQNVKTYGKNLIDNKYKTFLAAKLDNSLPAYNSSFP